MNYANINDNPILIYNDYPQTYNNTLNYPATAVQTKYNDGWRDVVYPTYDEATQYLGSIFFDVPNDYFTFPVINYTAQELEGAALEKNKQEQDVIVQQSLYSNELATLQVQAQSYDNDTALDNQALYPMWSGDGISLQVDNKVQYFDVNEMKLYIVLQAHTTQPAWNPPAVPALFTRMAYNGQILPWVQPTGANDAYPIGAKVTHNGFTWESTIAANTTEPEVTVFNWWVKI